MIHRRPAARYTVMLCALVGLALTFAGCGGTTDGGGTDSTSASSWDVAGSSDADTDPTSDGGGTATDTGTAGDASAGSPGDVDTLTDADPVPLLDGDDGPTDPDSGDGEEAAADAPEVAGEDAALEVATPAPVCTQNADCNDDNVCTEDKCIPDGGGGKLCSHAAIACETPDVCLGAACDPVNGCATELVSSDSCCFLGVIAEHDFEGGPGEETTEVLATDGAPPATWHLTSSRSFTGDTSYLFAIPGQGSYDNGHLVAGRLTLPPADLPKNMRTRLRFHVWADVEAGDVWDVLLVHVSDQDGSTDGPMPVWSKNYDNVTLSEWTTVDVDLAAFEGRTVDIAFTFNSTDHTFNDSEGIYLDGVWLIADCDEPSCQSDADCDDGLPCTAETCQGGWCAYDTAGACCALDVDCFDGDACTVDLCVEFSCDNPPVADADCCNTSEDCDDDNPCTSDFCQPGAQYKCQHPVMAVEGCCEDVSDCQDGDSCTIDVCDDAICNHINTCCFSDAECDDGDEVCTVDSCVGGACQFAFTGAAGCCEPEPWSETFDLGADGWTFTGGGSGCQWQVNSGSQSTSTPSALWYGAGSNYDCGATSGNATSPNITLQPGVGYSLSTMVWMDTESSSSFDVLELIAVMDGVTYPLWSKTNLPMLQWVELDFDLSAFAGKTFQLRWRFDTKDSIANGGAGPFVDDLFISSTCQSTPCGAPSECKDGLGFTSDQCTGGTCGWSF